MEPEKNSLSAPTPIFKSTPTFMSTKATKNKTEPPPPKKNYY